MAAVSNFSRALSEAEKGKQSSGRIRLVLLLIFFFYLLFGFASAYDGQGPYIPALHGWLHVLPYLKALLFT